LDCAKDIAAGLAGADGLQDWRAGRGVLGEGVGHEVLIGGTNGTDARVGGGGLGIGVPVGEGVDAVGDGLKTTGGAIVAVGGLVFDGGGRVG